MPDWEEIATGLIIANLIEFGIDLSDIKKLRKKYQIMLSGTVSTMPQLTPNNSPQLTPNNYSSSQLTDSYPSSQVLPKK
jgi:hypothetical protein